MLKIHLRAVGQAPLLMCAADNSTLQEVVAGPAKPSERTADELFQSKMYRAPDGRIALPQRMFLAALREAGRSVKLGRYAITNLESTLLASILTISEEFIYLDGGQPGTEPTVERDSRRGVQRNGRKKIRARIIRPKIKHWAFELTVMVNSRSHATIARQLFDKVGSEVCIGDFRPAEGLRKRLKANGWPAPFGRFMITEWEIQQVESPAEEFSLQM